VEVEVEEQLDILVEEEVEQVVILTSFPGGTKINFIRIWIYICSNYNWSRRSWSRRI
jgi:hypothetical protein